MAGEAEKAAATMMADQTNETSLSICRSQSLSPPPPPPPGLVLLHLLLLISFLPLNVKSTRGPSVGFIFFSESINSI